MTKELNTQWHPAFCSAIKLELREDAPYLEYINEYNINTKPLQIDLLIVKKLKELEVKNGIGKLFQTHNIIEYKSPDDSLNINTYLKVLAYAFLYKAAESHIDDIALEEITITMVRERKPIKLFRWFRDNGYQIIEKYEGIFYVTKEGHFPLQILVAKRLSKDNQKWLTLLRRDLVKEDARRVVSQMDTLAEGIERDYGDSVLQVAMKENEKLFRRLKEEEKEMCQALRELFEPELKEAVTLAEKDSRKTMILNALHTGSSAQDISKVMGIPLEEVEAIAKQV